jgi:hypothetical protein
MLVLGAGASVPYGFPTGKALVERIVSGTNASSGSLRVCLRNAGAEDATIDKLRDELDRTNFDSIDVFLEHHQQYRDVGKLAIAAVLIPCEREEYLSKPVFPDQHWYRLLFQQLAAWGSFNNTKLSIISLNYDRSLQQFLFNALIQDLEMPPDQAAAAVLNLDFVYLHGHLGDLPWRPGARSDDRFIRAYDPTLDPDHVKTAAAGIKIVSEMDWSRNTDLRMRVESLVAEADVVGFLGFGYHEPVIQRLNVVPIGGRKRHDYFGSTYGLPQGRRHELEKDFPAIVLGGVEDTVHSFLQNSMLLYQGRPPAGG